MPLSANLFRLESSILTRAKRATNRNNAAINRKNFRVFGGEHFLGEYTGVECFGGNFPGESIPRTEFDARLAEKKSAKYNIKQIQLILKQTQTLEKKICSFFQCTKFISYDFSANGM